MQGAEGFLQWNRRLGQEMQFLGTGIRRIATDGGRIRRVKSDKVGLIRLMIFRDESVAGGNVIAKWPEKWLVNG
jgi:hypothetical protein